MIIGALIGSLAGEAPPPSVSWNSVYYSTVLEGQENSVYLDFTNWDNSLIYWYITDVNNTQIASGQVSPNAGTMSPGTGDYGAYPSFGFTFSSDGLSDGQLTYYIRIENAAGDLLCPRQGPFYCVDSSQQPATVFGLEPASWANDIWPDEANAGAHNAITYNVVTNAQASGTLYFNGTTSYATISNLLNSTYGALTLTAWIKPTVINGITQTIIAKELCYKLRLNNNGTLSFTSGKGTAPWEITAVVGAGTVVGGQWSHIAVTSDASYTRIYVNGIKQVETNGNIIGVNSAVFDIGAYSDSGNVTQSDRFEGYMGRVYMASYAMNESSIISMYNQEADRYGKSVIPTSLALSTSPVMYMTVANDQTDWNLGSTYTIEYWSYTDGYSGSNVKTIMSQGSTGNQIDVGYMYNQYLFNNTQPQIEQPSPNSWNHIAWVSDSGSNVKLFVNGVEISTISPQSLTDGSHDLIIGRRGPNNFQYFEGNLTNLRVSAAARYSTTFIPAVTMSADSNDKLMLAGHSALGPTDDVSPSNHPISNNNVPLSRLFPARQSMDFVYSSESYLYAATSSAWNLGTTWTIEFWIKPNHGSLDGIGIPGGQWGLFNQDGWYTGGTFTDNSILIGMYGGKLTIAQSAGSGVEYTEPTAGVWTHVAVVNDGGTLTVYYNGVAQTLVSGSFSNNGWTSTSTLYIGRLAPSYGSFFDGKMANIRISNAVKYAAPFTASTDYYVEADTKLFLGNYNTFYDMTVARRVVSNSSILPSTDFPT